LGRRRNRFEVCETGSLEARELMRARLKIPRVLIANTRQTTRTGRQFLSLTPSNGGSSPERRHAHRAWCEQYPPLQPARAPAASGGGDEQTGSHHSLFPTTTGNILRHQLDFSLRTTPTRPPDQADPSAMMLVEIPGKLDTGAT
jgi:hypothetical protein